MSQTAMPATELSLAVRVGSALRAQQLTIVTAESCTGGLVATHLTTVPGSSDYYLGSVVAYSNRVKQQMLGVLDHTLDQHGPVSEQVARQMARGARLVFAAHCALSVTGILGPGGGTAQTPVGVVFIGLSTLQGTWVRRHHWTGTREANRQAAAEAALQLALDYLHEQM